MAPSTRSASPEVLTHAANLPTNIVDFRGFDSSLIILILRGGIPRPIGDFPESLSQAILVGILLVGGLGVPVSVKKDILRKTMHLGILASIIILIIIITMIVTSTIIVTYCYYYCYYYHYHYYLGQRQRPGDKSRKQIDNVNETDKSQSTESGAVEQPLPPDCICVLLTVDIIDYTDRLYYTDRIYAYTYIYIYILYICAIIISIHIGGCGAASAADLLRARARAKGITTPNTTTT